MPSGGFDRKDNCLLKKLFASAALQSKRVDGGSVERCLWIKVVAATRVTALSAASISPLSIGIWNW